MDFEGDTLELQVEKVTDGLVRVSTNAPAVRVLAKRYGDTGAAAADTRDTWMADTREKISAYQRVSTLATDGPSIICVQEPAISPLSQAG